MPPFVFSMSSTRNGTTSVSSTAASSLFEKPVTFRPFTNDAPDGSFTLRSTPGAWQTAATGLFVAIARSISAIE